MNDVADLPKELDDSIRQFCEEFERGLREFTASMDKPKTGILHHYTNESGLKGILKSGTLWLSNVFTQRDSSEWRWGISQVTDILRKAEGTQSAEFQRFITRWLTHIPWDKEVRNVAYAFICSMTQSENSDGNVHQWRDFGDRGRGYALEFDACTLSNFFESGQEIGSFTFEMLYGKQYLNKLAEKLKNDLCQAFIKLNPNDSTAQSGMLYLRTLIRKSNFYTVYLSLFFKKYKYQDENEYRLIQIFPAGKKPADVAVRRASGRNIQFRRFAWRTHQSNSLRRIIIGPAADYKKSCQIVNDCLNRSGLEGVEISRSNLLYRA